MNSRTKLAVAVLSVAVLVLLSSIILPLATVRADQALTLDAGTLNGAYASVAVEGTGNIFVTGSSLLMGQWPPLGVILTYTPQGNLLFRGSYPETFRLNPQDSFGSGVAIDTSQNVYFAGSTLKIGAAPGEFFNGFIVKYNPSMDIDWQTTWGGAISDAIPRAVATDAFDNLYVVGTTNGYWSGTGNRIAGLASVFLLKYDGRAGAQTFQATWGGITGNDYASSIAVDNLGHAYIVGTTYSNSPVKGQGSIFLLKYDLTGDLRDGELLWTRYWGGYNGTDYGYGVALDPTGNAYVVGTSYSYGLNSGQPSAVILKYDRNGNLLSQKIWGGSSADYGFGVATDILGNAYVVGTTYSYAMNPGHPNVFLLKYDPSGNLLYQKTWGGAEADYGYAVAVNQFGDAYVTGYTYSFGIYTYQGGVGSPGPYVNQNQNQNIAAMFLLKYDLNGNLVFQRIWSGTPLNQ